jgi:7,8-dihydropterin-6-yl-methyl-4-(beta-D-ribofuranosyl)aminobenzene 5'-phosphate synthase
MINPLKITVLYDNSSSQAGFVPAWGFACLIQGMADTILFDTGRDSSILLANMAKAGIRPEEVQVVVLSHEHEDHVDGLSGVLARQHDLTVYLPHAFPPWLKARVTSLGIPVVEVREPMKICYHVYSSGELGHYVKEQALLLQTERGVIIITGCGHPGVVNIIHKAKDLLNADILLVMGGFHAGGESEGSIEDIVSDFKELGVRYVGPCHCSIGAERQIFEKEYRQHCLPVGAGTVITLNDLP